MILIKGAQVVDGTGKPARKADVLLQNDKISAIGNFPNKKAETIIDGLGYYLTPGFIDVNTDSDHYLSLFTNPSQKDFLKQGVTTIIGGHCGSSLAPLLYGTLESIQKWADINEVNVDWHSMKEFLGILNHADLGVNFGTLIGHSTIRRGLIGEDLRDLTDSELRVFEDLIKKAMEEGALGLSTGLGYVHSRQTPYEEIKQLVQVIKKYNGVYTTHLRNEEEKLIESVKETIQLAKETNVRTLISHFRPLTGYEQNFEQSLELIENEAGKLDFHFDNYPFNASVIPLYTLLPSWPQSGGLKIMMANISDKNIQERIIKGLPQLKDDDIIIAHAPNADYLVGKSLGEFARNQGSDLYEALIDLMKVTGLRAVVIYKNINSELTIKSLMNKQALVASNSAGLKDAPGIFKHERFYNTFPKFLETIDKDKSLSFENAIKKLTSIPAQKFSIRRRGAIKEGYQADLAMIKDSKIHNVFVNGKLAIHDREFQNILGGMMIKR